MLKQTDILAAILALLKTKYPKPGTNYYTDEIVENFKQPCFFIKLIKTTNTSTKNTNSNNLSIILTYFANVAANKQLIFLDCEDNINELFGNGIQIGTERYLHIQSIGSERIGENQDILQITIPIIYLDSTGHDGNAGFDLMEELNMNTKNK